MNHQQQAVVAAQGLLMGKVQQVIACLIPPWAQAQQSSANYYANYHKSGELWNHPNTVSREEELVIILGEW